MGLNSFFVGGLGLERISCHFADRQLSDLWSCVITAEVNVLLTVDCGSRNIYK